LNQSRLLQARAASTIQNCQKGSLRTEFPHGAIDPETVPMAWSQSQAAASFDPVNYRKRDSSRIEQDVNYAFQILNSLQSQLDTCGLSVAGCNVVELGPGSSIGEQLILASMGARVTLADRFLPD
jgi:hypothetical protein